MSIIDINTLKEGDKIKFITPSKTLVDGTIKKICVDYLGITIDSRQNTYIFLVKDQSTELILVNDSQAFKCTSIVLGCTQNDFDQAVVISIPKIKLAIERREFERLSIIMDMEYSLLPFETSPQNLNSFEHKKYIRSLKKTYTVNISGGGIYFTIPKNENDSKFALISLSLKNEKIIALCEKIRTDHLDASNHNVAAYKYIDIKTHHRQLILDFIEEKAKKRKNA